MMVKEQRNHDMQKLLQIPKTLLVVIFFTVAGFCAAPTFSKSSENNIQDVAEAAPSSGQNKEATRFADKSTPLKSIQGFLASAGQGDYREAATYLDLRNLPKEVESIGGPQLARKLYVVLSRKVKLDMGAMSDDLEGATEKGVPSYRDILGRIESSQEVLTLFLQRVPDGEGARVWKVSNASVVNVPALYEKYGYSSFVEFFREHLPETRLLGTELFKWVIAILASVLATLVWHFLALPITKKISANRSADEPRIDRYLHRPVATFIFIVVGYWILYALGFGSLTGESDKRAVTIIIAVVVWLIFSTADLARDLYVNHLSSRGRESALMLVRPMMASFKLIVGTLAFITWLDNLGINITALLAGLGVGGLAIALVLQRPLEDILGAISLYTQQPVTVGQLCISGDTKGTIEEIGIRTTKIRTIEKTLVAIPNAVMARASIENISERPQILHRQTLRLAHNTTHDSLQKILSMFREILKEHSLVDQDSFRVRLLGFGDFSLDVEIFAYVYTSDWPTFLVVAEEINLDVLKVLESNGISLAMPRL